MLKINTRFKSLQKKSKKLTQLNETTTTNHLQC